MEESRGGKYGRNLSIWIDYTISTFSSKSHYKERFLEEMADFSFEPRKRGAAQNAGCIYALEGINSINIYNPTDLACLTKEGIHLMYQKQTEARVMDALLRGLQKSC